MKMYVVTWITWELSAANEDRTMKNKFWDELDVSGSFYHSYDAAMLEVKTFPEEAPGGHGDTDAADDGMLTIELPPIHEWSIERNNLETTWSYFPFLNDKLYSDEGNAWAIRITEREIKQ